MYRPSTGFTQTPNSSTGRMFGSRLSNLHWATNNANNKYKQIRMSSFRILLPH